MHRLNDNFLRAVCFTAVSSILASCEAGPGSQPAQKSPPPESWQIHLKPTTLDDSAILRKAESLYIPIYSHIYVENEQRTADLAATLSVRNVDPDHPIILKSVRYYSSDGKLLKEYLKNPVLVDPLATADFVIARQDSSGGTGANFIVDWVSKFDVVEPLAESVMVATGSPQSMSFTSRGVVIKKLDKKPSGK